MSASPPRSPAPPRLPDRYDAQRHIASGGMAAVWCAEDRVLGRKVAVKILADRFASDQVAVHRFKREARAAARVSNHPHVVTVYDVGDLEPERGEATGSRAFLVMEYLAGGTVADAIRVGAVRRREALRWLGEAASALDHAHARGIVHRDIKPANFLLDRSRVLHVADFGIARLMSEDTITSTDQLFGTAAYLSPEQALGRPATGASDRYALAVAAFELLAGERPFTATHFAAQARQHIEDPPPAASGRDHTLPEAVDHVLARAMAKDPDERYASAGDFVAALGDALDGAPTAAVARPPSAATRLLAPATRPPGTRPPATRPPATRPPGMRSAATRRPPVVARRRGGRAIALAGLLVVAIAITAAAMAAGSGGSGSTGVRGSGTSTRRALASAGTARARSTSTRSSTSSAGTTGATTAAPPTTTVDTSAQQLQAAGHEEMLDGDYQTAIPTLRQAVSNASPTSLTYAYALYDLGRSLVLSGDPSSAIPVLQARLRIDNQTPVVRQMLDQALRASGQTQSGSSSSSTTPTGPTAPAPTTPVPGPPPGHGHGHGHGPHGSPGNGGAGLPGAAHGQDVGDDLAGGGLTD